MSVAHKSTVADMAKFKPREPRDEVRILVVRSLKEDLDLIAEVRTRVNELSGDGTMISVTSMGLDELTELREEQFKEWGGKPTTPAAKEALIERLVAAFGKPDSPDALAKTKKKP